MRERLFWLIPVLPVLALVAGTVAVGGWTPGGRPARHGGALQPLLRACEADLRRQHPQAPAFRLAVEKHDSVSNEVGVDGHHLRWQLSGTLTTLGDGERFVFDCDLDQAGAAVGVTFSHASVWWTPPPD
ncbi:hypothetical protein HNQ07_001591 [Deinococcus metalli]|uniref:Uncharacterized protein n=1 Tax=Deinococcus metalli TaxID=1141878 RepID=A0A7W8KDF5_9DEIO|nr:hypothetical protein [Deinococcus metalli]MBB5376134.1 hypothetical protein [Deinococcus metalli]GHF40542.1 hypothetical protein GCM10017781_16480 [Deinococcus metalli]